MPTSERVQLSYSRTYPPSSKAVGWARRDVVEFARECGFAGQILDDIEVSVGEGLANAVEHGQRDKMGFEVLVRRNVDSLIVEIKDRGRGFDFGSVCANERPPSEAVRGFGTFIMRELMDEISYTEYGTRLRLIKRIPAPATNERSAVRA